MTTPTEPHAWLPLYAEGIWPADPTNAAVLRHTFMALVQRIMEMKERSKHHRAILVTPERVILNVSSLWMTTPAEPATPHIDSLRRTFVHAVGAVLYVESTCINAHGFHGGSLVVRSRTHEPITGVIMPTGDVAEIGGHKLPNLWVPDEAEEQLAAQLRPPFRAMCDACIENVGESPDVLDTATKLQKEMAERVLREAGLITTDDKDLN